MVTVEYKRVENAFPVTTSYAATTVTQSVPPPAPQDVVMQFIADLRSGAAIPVLQEAIRDGYNSEAMVTYNDIGIAKFGVPGHGAIGPIPSESGTFLVAIPVEAKPRAVVHPGCVYLGVPAVAYAPFFTVQATLETYSEDLVRHLESLGLGPIDVVTAAAADLLVAAVDRYVVDGLRTAARNTGLEITHYEPFQAKHVEAGVALLRDAVELDCRDKYTVVATRGRAAMLEEHSGSDHFVSDPKLLSPHLPSVENQDSFRQPQSTAYGTEVYVVANDAVKAFKRGEITVGASFNGRKIAIDVGMEIALAVPDPKKVVLISRVV